MRLHQQFHHPPRLQRSYRFHHCILISITPLIDQSNVLVSRDMTVELNVHRDIMPRKFPRIEVQPIIWYLYLVAVDNFLLENTISISQAISPGRVIQCSHAVEETCSQPAETTIAEGCVMLLGYDILNSEPQVFQTSYTKYLAAPFQVIGLDIRTSGDVLQTNVEHGIVQCSSHQKF